MKVNQLDRFLKTHKPTCAYFIHSGDRHCSCGRDAAQEELADLRAELKRKNFPLANWPCPSCGYVNQGKSSECAHCLKKRVPEKE